MCRRKVVAFTVLMAMVLTACQPNLKETVETVSTETVSVEMESSESSSKEAESQETLSEEDSTQSEDSSESSFIEQSSEEETEITESQEKEELPEFQVNKFKESRTMYAKSPVNVRKGPSTKFEILSHLKAGQEVKVTGQADTKWYEIQLGDQLGYTSHRYLSEEKIEEQPVAENQQPVAQNQQPTAQENPKAEAPATATTAPAGVIMVGDSRCVQMKEAVGGGGCSWICENSKEYTWFVEKGIPKFDASVGKGTKVVINMGVNDPEHYKDYVATVNAKAAEWAGRGATTYFVSVNPVWENPYVTQEQVDTFNANVPGMLTSVHWIDTASWLNSNGYKLVDGLHYDDDTYVNIFNVIMGSL